MGLATITAAARDPTTAAWCFASVTKVTSFSPAASIGLIPAIRALRARGRTDHGGPEPLR